MSRLPWLFLLAAVANGLPAAAPGEDLNVITRWPRYTDPGRMLYHTLADQGMARMEQRSAEVARLQSTADWQKRQQHVLRVLREEIMGPFPERAPLNGRVTGVIRKPGYRIEKVVFESQPRFYVTAALFIPEPAQRPAPAIVFASGHTADAFRNVDPGSSYQWLVLNLVKKGFIVFAFDPIGQGERTQAFDPAKNASVLGKASAQHGFIGTLPFLANSWLGAAMAWDGVRAIDYLETRPEVDMKRIGMFGNSGGGTQTAYTSAIDERVLVSVPGNYITNFHRLLTTRGPQDPEQYLYQQLARGIDHADYLVARAPRPTLVVATTRDFFNIQGSHETVREVRRAFAALGAPDNIGLVEDDHEHGYTRKTREATYAFFQKHLGRPGSPVDEPVEFATPAELRVTETGQVATSLGGESFFTFSRQAARRLAARLEAARRGGAGHRENVRDAAKRLSGYKAPDRAPATLFNGRYQRSGYAVERHLLTGDSGLPVPFLLFVPAAADGARYPVAIHLHPKGKQADAAIGGDIERIVRQGHAVLAPDLIGIGETGVAGSVDGWEMAMLLGRSLAGIRAGDIVRLVRFLQSRSDIDPQRIAGVAHGELAVELLHAATFEPAIGRIALLSPPVSYRALLEEELADRRFVDGAVAAALTAYDLPDLAAALERPLWMANPVDARMQPASPELIERDLAFVREAYRGHARAELSLQAGPPAANRINQLVAWLAAGQQPR